MKDSDQFTVPMAAAELGVTHMTIRRWIKAGLLTPKKVGRYLLLTRRQLHAVKRPNLGRRPHRAAASATRTSAT